MAGGAAYSPPSVPGHHHHHHHHASSSYRPVPGSPGSNHSSPYVSPRLHNRLPSDQATAPTSQNYAPPMRRGAVSGASGPLSFPPLPNPLRHSTSGPSSDGGPPKEIPGSHSVPHNAGYYDRNRADAEHHHPQASYYGDSSSGHYASHTHQSSQYPPQQQNYWGGSSGYEQYRQGSYSGASGPSFLSSSSNAGPSFPLSSSYSLSSSSSNPASFAGAQPPYAGTQRRSIFGSSLGGMYGSSGLPPPTTPYWQSGSGSGLKRKQTSVNPPPRNYACPSCPASFSRRHDLNRHSRIHLAVKPFGCPNCAKTFSRKDALKRHLVVKGCGKDSEGRPKKRRGRKSAAELAANAAAAAAAANQASEGASGAATGSSGLGIYGGHGYSQGYGNYPSHDSGLSGSAENDLTDGGRSDEEDEDEEEEEVASGDDVMSAEDYSMVSEGGRESSNHPSGRSGSVSFHMN